MKDRTVGGGSPAADRKLTDTHTLSAHVAQFGYTPAAARLEVEPRSLAARRMRGLITVVVCIAVAPIVFFIPPHAEWLLALVVGGGLETRRQLLAQYRVLSFEGECPRCGAALRMRSGTLLRLPHGINCTSCRTESRLEEGPVPEDAANVREAAAPLTPPQELAELDAATRARIERLMKRRRPTTASSPGRTDS